MKKGELKNQMAKRSLRKVEQLWNVTSLKNRNDLIRCPSRCPSRCQRMQSSFPVDMAVRRVQILRSKGVMGVYYILFSL